MTASPWDFGVKNELEMVERKLRGMVKSDESILTDASLHVIEAGGKRLRPTVTILTYKALGGNDIDKIVDIATGFELIHSATLVHDDINDGGVTRRGRETVYKKFGLHDAVVTGDFLFVKAFQLGGAFDKNVVSLTADACAKLAEGEVMQNRFRHKKNLSVDSYLEIMERKTAYPIKVGAMVGAYLAHAPEDIIQNMGSYGLDLGIAFQIIDDVLDFTGDQKKTGKMSGMDLKDGHLTLPSLLAIKDSPAVKDAIAEVISSEEPSPENVSKCVELVIKSGAIGKSKGMAEYYGIEALGHLGCMPKNAETEGLRNLVRRVIERDS